MQESEALQPDSPLKYLLEATVYRAAGDAAKERGAEVLEDVAVRLSTALGRLEELYPKSGEFAVMHLAVLVDDYVASGSSDHASQGVADTLDAAMAATDNGVVGALITKLREIHEAGDGFGAEAEFGADAPLQSVLLYELVFRRHGENDPEREDKDYLKGRDYWETYCILYPDKEVLLSGLFMSPSPWEPDCSKGENFAKLAVEYFAKAANRGCGAAQAELGRIHGEWLARQEQARRERARTRKRLVQVLRERVRQEQAKQERAKQEQSHQSAVRLRRRWQAKQERAKQERAKQERAKQERAKQERDRQEQAKQERAKQERAKQERDRQERAKQERERQERERQERERQEQAVGVRRDAVGVGDGFFGAEASSGPDRWVVVLGLIFIFFACLSFCHKPPNKADKTVKSNGASTASRSAEPQRPTARTADTASNAFENLPPDFKTFFQRMLSDQSSSDPGVACRAYAERNIDYAYSKVPVSRQYLMGEYERLFKRYPKRKYDLMGVGVSGFSTRKVELAYRERYSYAGERNASGVRVVSLVCEKMTVGWQITKWSEVIEVKN
jgi:flagellar biosynthesis GTPase FlhF